MYGLRMIYKGFNKLLEKLLISFHSIRIKN
jgi:hypothetical protein